MRKAFKHTGVLMMVTLIGLSIVGAAYALWFEDLSLTANVTTGTFNVDWSCDTSNHNAHSINNPCPATATQPIVSLDAGVSGYGLFPANKPPVSCSSGITSSGLAADANDTADANVLTLHADGLYPYTGCDYYIDIHNTGSVPAHFTVTSDTLPGNNVNVSVIDANCTHGGVDPCQGTLATANGALTACQTLLSPTNAQLNVDNGSNIQLHNSNHLGCTVRITLNQGAAENAGGPDGPAAYTWSLKIVGHQWNEIVP